MSIREEEFVADRSLTAAAPGLLAHVIGEHGAAKFRASGTSMLPLLRPGDVLTVRRCTRQHLIPGRILLIACGDRLLAHRLVCVRDSADGLVLTTRGDAHRQCDPDVRWSQTIGWIDAVERNGHLRSAPRCTMFHRVVGIALNESLAVLQRSRLVARRMLHTDLT